MLGARYRGLTACFVFGILCSWTSVRGDPAPGAPAARPVFVEQGPTVTAYSKIDGSPIESHSFSVTTPFCASPIGNMTNEQFRAIVLDMRAKAALLPAPEPIEDNPTPHAGFTLNLSVSGALPAGAPAAVAAVKSLFESTFRDPITVAINVVFVDQGNNGVLGSTGSEFQTVPYATARAALISGKDADDLVQDFLPNTLQARFGVASPLTTVNTLSPTRANFKAAIGTIASTPDANMSINTGYTFDYDPADGITPGQTCFRSVFVHEILHALGFVSSADGFPSDPSILDIYRFQRSANNPQNFSQFGSFPRMIGFNDPDDDQNFDTGAVEYRMSDGFPNQASHWRDQGGVPQSAIGIMQPAMAPGVTFAPDYFFQADIDAMDAIGWDKTGATGSGDCATCNVTFKANANTAGVFPPMPSCAAGPVSVLSIVDRNFALYDKVGNNIFTSEFEPFFSSLRTTDIDFAAYRAPRALFDPYLQKFVISAIGTKSNAANQVTDSWLLFAVSKTDRPTLAADWSKFAIKTSSESAFSDDPALGYDENNLYFTYNMTVKATNAFQGVQQHAIEKGLLASSDPPTQIPNRFFNAGGFSHVPVQSFGTTKTQWFVYQAQSFNEQNTIHLFFRGNKTVPGDTSNLTGDFAVQVPPFTSASPARQKQSGAVIPPQLDSPGDRIMSAVARGNSVWATHTVNGANGSEVRWYEFDTTVFPSAPVLKQSGAVGVGQGGIGGAIDNFNPAIMVSAAGDMMVSFTSAGPQNFPSMVYTWRAKTDALGLTRTPELVKAGPRSYLGSGTGLEKWGLYSGIALDPSDQATFWMFNQVPNTTGNWETWFGGATLTLVGGGGGGGSLPVPSSLHLDSPNGGENLVTKIGRLIKWTATGDGTAPVSLFLYKGTTLLGPIATNLSAGSGAPGFIWTVGTLQNNAAVTSDPSYRIRVSSVNDPSIFDDSDAFVRITEKVDVTAGVPDNSSTLAPSFVFGPGDTVPLQANATKGQPPYFYQWSPQDFLSNANVSNPTAVPTRTIVYTVTVSDATGASTSKDVTLTSGNPLKANAGADLLYPAGGSVILEGSVNGGTPPYTVQWFTCDPAVVSCNTPIATTIQPTVIPTGPTTYFLRVADSAAAVKTDSVSVEPGFTIGFENEPGNGGVVVKSPNKSLFRPGETVTITAQPAGGFAFANWSNGATGSTNPLVISFPNQNLTVRAIYTAISSSTGDPSNPGTNPTPPTDCGLGIGSGLMVSLAALTFVRLGRSRRRKQ